MVYIHHLITEDGDFMSLNINSPAYFTSVYGVIDEIYRMCSDITNKIDLKKYTNTFDNIGITPIIAPTEEIDKGKCKEVRKILTKSKLAIVSLHIDYEIYCNANVQEKKDLILQNIFASLLIISKKAKNDFNYEKLVNDILSIVK
jgi:hypothetical protein